MKKVILFSLIIIIIFSSCARTFTPYQAANTGGKTCKDRHRIR